MANQHFHAAFAATTGHTCYTQSVTVDCAHRTGHVRTVAVSVDIGRIDHKVVTIYVVGITIAVVIDTGFTVLFCFVYIHILCQIGVIYLETAIDDSHKYIFLTRFDFPSFEHISVGTSHSSGNRAVVVVVPLARQHGVVERHSRRSIGIQV